MIYAKFSHLGSEASLESSKGRRNLQGKCKWDALQSYLTNMLLWELEIFPTALLMTLNLC